MTMFRFGFSVEPTSATPQADDIARADAEVWVLESDIEAAETKARSYLMDYSWIVKHIEYSEMLPDELCPDPDRDTISASLFRKAEIHGIAANFYAVPKVPRPGVYEYRPMGAPQIKKS